MPIVLRLDREGSDSNGIALGVLIWRSDQFWCGEMFDGSGCAHSRYTHNLSDGPQADVKNSTRRRDSCPSRLEY